MIDYVNAHGTSTPQGDVVETRALRAVFGEPRAQGSISSHQIDDRPPARGPEGWRRRFTALAIFHDIAPPTINYTTPDPECDLDYVPTSGASDHFTTRSTTRSGSGDERLPDPQEARR